MNEQDQSKQKSRKQQKEEKKTVLSRVPPNDFQAEQAVLGAAFIDDTAFNLIVDYVGVDSFYWNKHGIVFQVMLDLFHENEPTDLVTVSTRLRKSNKLEEVGGDFYLAELSDAVPFPKNVEYYAKIVQEKYLLRSIGLISEDVAGQIFEPDVSANDVLDKGINQFFELQAKGETSGYQDLRAVTHETMEYLDKLSKNKGNLTGVGTGYYELNRKTGGFQDSDLVILAARPSMGKTALALCFARNAARNHKVPVGVISLEMSSKQIAMRLLSIEAQIKLYHIRTGSIHKDDWPRVANAASNISQYPIFIDDTPGQSITDIRARAKRLHNRHDVGILFIDYLQLIQPPKGSESQQQAIATISRQLKGLAKELDIPIIALSQLSRAVETRGGSKRPILSDLRDSGALEQDADIVMFVFRQKYYDKLEKKDLEDGYVPNDAAEVIIAKQRNGPTGTVELIFREDYAEFAKLSDQPDESAPPPKRGGDDEF